MVLDAKELSALALISYQGNIPAFKGIGYILPSGVENALKWKSQLGLERETKKVKKKLQEQGLWGKKEFEQLIMSIIVHENEIVFLEGESYIKSFFQSKYGYAYLEFNEKGEYRIELLKDEKAWIDEINYFINGFFSNLEYQSKKIFLNERKKGKRSSIELNFRQEDNGIIYKMIEKKVVKEENMIENYNIYKLIQKIMLEGEK